MSLAESDAETLVSMIYKGEAMCGARLSMEQFGETDKAGCGSKNLRYVRSSSCGFWFECVDCQKTTYVNRP